MNPEHDESGPPEERTGRESEPFLARWSRRKEKARRDTAEMPSMPQPPAQMEQPLPELPSPEKLTLESDFRGFMHPKVSEDLRRAALKKLFSDPHFNVMDGLDVYIDDYSKSEPIPAAMLASLRQAQKILEWAKEDEEQRSAQHQVAAERAPQALPHEGGMASADNVPRPTDNVPDNAGSATKA